MSQSVGRKISSESISFFFLELVDNNYIYHILYINKLYPPNLVCKKELLLQTLILNTESKTFGCISVLQSEH